jgi:hypothetical protein
VRVVFVTDGAAGDPLGYYGSLDYGGLRREEAKRAAEVLGVKELKSTPIIGPALRGAPTPPTVYHYEIWAAIEPTHLIDITA